MPQHPHKNSHSQQLQVPSRCDGVVGKTLKISTHMVNFLIEFRDHPLIIYFIFNVSAAFVKAVLGFKYYKSSEGESGRIGMKFPRGLTHSPPRVCAIGFNDTVSPLSPAVSLHPFGWSRCQRQTLVSAVCVNTPTEQQRRCRATANETVIIRG